LEIKPVDQTVEKLLKSAFYKIPRFQRPYSWDRENVEDFWNDAVTADDPDYFIGSFVVYKSNSPHDPLFVVDGQQRLTTLTLLLAAVRDDLDALAYKDLARGVHQLIERPDINNEAQYVLQTETSYPFLHEHIQKYGTPELCGDLGAEEEALKAAYEFLRGQLSSTLTGIDADQTLTEEKKRDAKKDKLISIREKALRLQLILIELTSEDDAYLIFETLNTRGKDLTISDLVKNHLTRLLKPTNKGVDATRDKWNGILELFDASTAEIDVNRFIHHFWLSRSPYITERKLFKEIKRTVAKPKAKEFLDALSQDARIYRTLFEPDWHKWKKEEHELHDSIRALNLFRVVQPVPMLLSILRDYISKQLTLKQARSILRSMEDFHAQFTGVTQQRTGGGTAKMYALAARQLTAASGKDAKARVIKEFLGKLRERVPSLAEFEAGFADLRYSAEATKQRPLIRYLLRRIDIALRRGPTVDYDRMSIEHIAPQNPPAKSGVPPEAMSAIGNLILVPEKLNEKLANKSFEAKRRLLQKEKVPVDETLQAAEEWTAEGIQERGKALAKLCHDKVFKI
jgi:hypothetical protein